MERQSYSGYVGAGPTAESTTAATTALSAATESICCHKSASEDWKAGSKLSSFSATANASDGLEAWTDTAIAANPGNAARVSGRGFCCACVRWRFAEHGRQLGAINVSCGQFSFDVYW